MGVAKTIYRAIFRKSSTMAVTAVVGAFFFERGFDIITEKLFHLHNKGKLWDDIKHNYVKS